jgi:hypothetical protein
MRWEQDNFWSLAFGALAVLGVIGLIALLISYLSRMGVGR